VLSDLWAWANANSGGIALLTLVAIPVGAVIGQIASLRAGVAITVILRDPPSYPQLAAEYRGTGSDS